MYNVPLKTVTIREVLAAIEEGGFEHLRLEWISFDENGKPLL